VAGRGAKRKTMMALKNSGQKNSDFKDKKKSQAEGIKKGVAKGGRGQKKKKKLTGRNIKFSHEKKSRVKKRARDRNLTEEGYRGSTKDANVVRKRSSVFNSMEGKPERGDESVR